MEKRFSRYKMSHKTDMKVFLERNWCSGPESKTIRYVQTISLKNGACFICHFYLHWIAMLGVQIIRALFFWYHLNMDYFTFGIQLHKTVFGFLIIFPIFINQSVYQNQKRTSFRQEVIERLELTQQKLHWQLFCAKAYFWGYFSPRK